MHGSNGAAQISFRDPAGFLFELNGRLFRILSPDAAQPLHKFLADPSGVRAVESYSFIPCKPLDPVEAVSVLAAAAAAHPHVSTTRAEVLEHPKLFFPSYPFEWPSSMLSAAGALTLSLARQLIPLGLNLKDATPFNILFEGSQPVFIDALSIESRDPLDTVWRPYDQFVRTFILPLLSQKLHREPSTWATLHSREGVPVEDFYPRLSAIERLRQPMFELVTMPTWLASRKGSQSKAIYSPRHAKEPAQAQFILESLLSRLEKHLRRSSVQEATHSTWSDYQQNCHYSAADAAAKRTFVLSAQSDPSIQHVLDIGANTGEYCLPAARNGRSVVAIDSDIQAVEKLFQTAAAEKLPLLPLTVDIARPTPATGWDNSETTSFLHRACRKFDLVQMLALVHHLAVTERLPFSFIARLAAQLTRNRLVIEFVGPGDPFYQTLLRGRDHLHTGYTQSAFEEAFAAHFHTVRSLSLCQGRRHLYELQLREEA